MGFNQNVFVNCPFDDDYRMMVRPLVFTLLFLDFEPKISFTSSSGEIRVSNIKGLIRSSKYGIHDISRSKPMRNGDLPRFNMPFELGLDAGCCEYGGKKMKEKKMLVLDTERYHYQKVLSDISGQDIASHNDDPRKLIGVVRKWLAAQDLTADIPGATKIWNAYNQFSADLIDGLMAKGFTADEVMEMDVFEYIKYARKWIVEFFD
jgi:hypothetical protein